MSAIRLARGFTGRDLIVKFEGCYHGHADSLLVKAGSGALTLGVPDSAGVPAAIAAATTTLPYNDAAALERCFAELGARDRLRDRRAGGRQHGLRAARAGLPRSAARATARATAPLLDLRRGDDRLPRRARRRAGALRHHARPDDARARSSAAACRSARSAAGATIMERIAPLGPVYQAGTLSGNPVAMAAGLATLEAISRPGFHARLAQATDRLVDGLAAAARDAGVPLAANRVCGMFGLFFTADGPVTDYRQVMASDAARFRRFFHGMLEAGVYLAPSPFEAGFVSCRAWRRRNRRDDRGRRPASSRHRAGALMRAALAFLGVIFGTLLLAALARLAGVERDPRARARLAVPPRRQPALAADPAARLPGRDAQAPACAAARTGATACRARRSSASSRPGSRSASRPCCRCRSRCTRSASTRCGRNSDPSLLAGAVAEGALVGLVVAVVEETFFRGLMYRAIDRESGFAAAAACTALVYASIHFFARVKIPAEEVAWDSGSACSAGRSRISSNPLRSSTRS